MAQEQYKQIVERINENIESIKKGDQKIWEELQPDVREFVRYCAKRRIRGYAVENREALIAELASAGFIGFMQAIPKYSGTGKAKFTTYAGKWIDGAISTQLDFEFNSAGYKKKPINVKVTKIAPKSDDEKDLQDYEAMLSGALAQHTGDALSIKSCSDLGSYATERTVLQIMDVLKMMTDEEHSLTCNQLKALLSLYRKAKYQNATNIESYNVFNKTMGEMLLELNPEIHTQENDEDYKIKYKKYEENDLNNRVNMKKENPNKVDTAPVINGLQYVHDFDRETLDKLIQVVSFSDMFSKEEKTTLIRKLLKTASIYYRTPYMNGRDLRFHPSAIHGRFSTRSMEDRKGFAEKLKILQDAINKFAQVRFRFNRYTEDHELTPTSQYIHTLSPYHIVVYQDQYYCIGKKQGDKRVWHYRIDLMTEIELIRDEDGMIIPIEITAFEGLPISNTEWDPEKYMSEHLSMGYDKPQDIRIKILSTDYTVLHDAFGDHYKKVESRMEKNEKGRMVQYDIVMVKTSPEMLVHWAMQQGAKVEILDRKVREKIREELKKMQDIYS
ncbi:MAG: WYL domain-containing protein [Lachnospiraceae bacterium]|nr:WYL domain-containing protein [Lachnospiraceae bacterium]